MKTLKISAAMFLAAALGCSNASFSGGEKAPARTVSKPAKSTDVTSPDAPVPTPVPSSSDATAPAIQVDTNESSPSISTDSATETKKKPPVCTVVAFPVGNAGCTPGQAAVWGAGCTGGQHFMAGYVGTGICTDGYGLWGVYPVSSSGAVNTASVVEAGGGACDSGYVMIGWSNCHALCAPMNPGYTLAPTGNGGGFPWSYNQGSHCPAGQVVTGITGQMNFQDPSADNYPICAQITHCQ